MSPKPLTVNPALRNVVYRNQWREVFDGTLPADWQPSLRVSVVIASYNSATLPYTLASLAAQDYPDELLDVVVVDDGSQPPVELGDVVHKNTKLIRVQDGEGWGRSNATSIGINATDGDIIYWLDSDMVLFRDNVREHAKWAHFIPEAATIGHKGFVESWDFTPERVYELVRSGEVERLYDLESLHRHWSLDVFERTDDLNNSAGRNYATHMGACATVTREVYQRTFGQDLSLHLGEDTEIAYQLWQAGAVFVPVNEARTLHLGRATIQDRAEQVAHHNDVFFAQRMPIPRGRRRAQNRQWTVPYITAVVRVDRETAPYARACVDRLLNSTETDLKILLVGPWSTLHGERRKIFTDPDRELYLVREWYRNEGRVELVEEAPDTVFPSPYRIDVPVTVGLAAHSLDKIMRQVWHEQIGVASFFAPGAAKSETVTVWHTPALSRALGYVSESVSLREALDAVWSVEWHSSEGLNLLDLREPDTDLDAKISRTVQQVERLTVRLARTEAKLRKLQARKPQPVRDQARRGVAKVLRAAARGYRNRRARAAGNLP